MQSAKHKLSTQGSLLFQSYRAKYIQAQFLPAIVDLLVCNQNYLQTRSHLLESKSILSLFIKSHCKSNHTSTK